MIVQLLAERENTRRPTSQYASPDCRYFIEFFILSKTYV